MFFKSFLCAKYSPVGLALLAAFLFGLNAPFSKLLLGELSPMLMVAFLYLGAGLGIAFLQLFFKQRQQEAKLTKKELPWVISMILLDVVAPFLLMCGLRLTTSANASLLFNFEMVATAFFALIFFHETIGKRMWLSISCITLASIGLSVDFLNLSVWRFSWGGLLVLLACCSWGLENNCTRQIADKSPADIVIIKGIGSGLTALVIAFLQGEKLPQLLAPILWTLVLGFVAYGLSIYLYVKAQRYLGAARTSAYYATAPFMGVVLSFMVLGEKPTEGLLLASGLMIIGVVIAMYERHGHEHVHTYMIHEHAHIHDEHHTHIHEPPVVGWHTHEHIHEEILHCHQHTPDIHHRHQHG